MKDVSDYVTYNMNGADNTSADRSITFQNQYTDGAFSSTMTSDEEAPYTWNGKGQPEALLRGGTAGDSGRLRC